MAKSNPKPDRICDQELPIKANLYCDNFVDLYICNCHGFSKEAVKPIGSKIEKKSYKTTAKCCDYVYCVCWSDDRVRNGFLAEFIGGTSVFSNHRDWEVYATGLDYDSASPRPARDLVFDQIKKVDCKKLWKTPFEGPRNTKKPAPKPFKYVNYVSSQAHFIWYNSGNDSHTDAPFKGFNHDEFLIFRLPVKKLYPKKCAKCQCEACECCDCGCSGCDVNAKKKENQLAQRANKKSKIIPGSANISGLCTAKPYKEVDCKPITRLKKLDLCFYLHWGDSAQDQIETHDTEVMYLSVCNRYADLEFKGLRITKLTIIPNKPLNEIQVVPDAFIHFDCLSPCSCKSRELALLTRDVPPGGYRIEVEYCVDEVVLKLGVDGKTSFPIKVIKD